VESKCRLRFIEASLLGAKEEKERRRMSTLWGKPKSRNVQIEHWLHSLEEVEQVARSVEPKLVSTTAKWKGASMFLLSVKCGP